MKKMKNTMTFRTDCEADNERVPALLSMLGIRDYEFRETYDNLMPDYKVGVYSFKTVMHIREVEIKIKDLIRLPQGDDTYFFEDMHQCWQTLQYGNDCKEIHEDYIEEKDVRKKLYMVDGEGTWGADTNYYTNPKGRQRGLGYFGYPVSEDEGYMPYFGEHKLKNNLGGDGFYKLSDFEIVEVN